MLYTGRILEMQVILKNCGTKWKWKIANICQKSIIFERILQESIFEQIHWRTFCRGNINLVFVFNLDFRTLSWKQSWRNSQIFFRVKKPFFQKLENQTCLQNQRTQILKRKWNCVYTISSKKQKSISKMPNMLGRQHFFLESFKRKF